MIVSEVASQLLLEPETFKSLLVYTTLQDTVVVAETLTFVL